MQLSLLGSILSNMLLGTLSDVFLPPLRPTLRTFCAHSGVSSAQIGWTFRPNSFHPTACRLSPAVLGCAYLFGGTRFKEQTFNKEGVMMNFGLLLLSVMGLSLPAMLHFTHTELHGTSSELALSRFAACILLIIYIAFLYFQLMTHRDLYEEEDEGDDDDDDEEEIVLTFWGGIGWLTVITIFISILSDYLVDAIEGASAQWDISTAFISVRIG